jgi:hypothetical protein
MMMKMEGVAGKEIICKMWAASSQTAAPFGNDPSELRNQYGDI